MAVFLLIIGSIGLLPFTSPYKHTMIVSGNAKSRFVAEHDTVPLEISPCLSVTATFQMQLPVLWGVMTAHMGWGTSSLADVIKKECKKDTCCKKSNIGVLMAGVHLMWFFKALHGLFWSPHFPIGLKHEVMETSACVIAHYGHLALCKPAMHLLWNSVKGWY